MLSRKPQNSSETRSKHLTVVDENDGQARGQLHHGPLSLGAVDAGS